MTTHYRLSDAECIKYFAQLDRIGIIELRPLNRYRLKLAKTFRWRPHGAVMNYFREHAVLDYFSGGFDGSGEGVLLVHGSISRGLAPSFLERMKRVAQDFVQQHQADQKLAEKDREGPCAAGNSPRSRHCGAEGSCGLHNPQVSTRKKRKSPPNPIGAPSTSAE